MNKFRLSLVDAPYNEKNHTEPVYTLAFNRPKKERDGFVAKVRNNIYGTIRNIRRNRQ